MQPRADFGSSPGDTSAPSHCLRWGFPGATEAGPVFPPTTRAERSAKCNLIRNRATPQTTRQHLAEVVAAFLAPFVDRGGRATVSDDEAMDLMVLAT